MRTAITQALVRALPAEDHDLWDTVFPGLLLRTRASGRHTWLVSLGRKRLLTLGRVDVLKPAEARELARAALGDQAHGQDPIAAKRKQASVTLETFLTRDFDPWAIANRKRGAAIGARVRAAFPAFLTMALEAISPFAIERWRTARHTAGARPATTNRDLNAIGSVLSRAVEWGALRDNPARKVKRATIDSLARVRYLTDVEATRLRDTLEARDTRHREARVRANAWREARGYRLWPRLGVYADHLTPVVLLALNTGLRRGSLLQLRWADVDLVANRLTVRGASAKAGITYYVPLTAEALRVLRAWRGSAPVGEWLFPDRDGQPMTTLKTAWLKVAKAAGLVDFRFHDLRHDFASRLARAGVDLLTIQELLGHRDPRMSRRYAHISDEHKAAAIAKIG